MNYQEFINDVVKHISSSVHNGQKVSIQPVIKNNGTVLDGLIILDPILNISPTIYLNPYYHRYLNGVSMENIYEDILETYYKNVPKEDFDISLFKDFEKASKYITFKLVNKEKNKELLQEIPYINLQDLVLIFQCALFDYLDEYATILIYNQHLSFWNITVEELCEIAIANTPKLLSPHFENMENILEQLDCPCHFEFEQVSMYILTNSLKVHGATCIAYPGLLKQISNYLDDNLIIIPSSIHEVLIIPENKTKLAYTSDNFNAMIAEINETELSDEEILSNHVYYFNKDSGELSY